jgi:hypothetical protein
MLLDVTARAIIVAVYLEGSMVFTKPNVVRRSHCVS